ncbi:MAG: transposase [Verrucomicrobia bacterium]|nr:transposase [Verrucomicrobiota bacterium]
MPHAVPSWVSEGAIYFVTICAKPRGINTLATADIAPWLLETLAFRERRDDWYLHLVLIMPDHIHLLMSFPRVPGMVQSLGQWKRLVAREKGIHWQQGFFEHRLRSDESLVKKAHYIRENPVRAGLCVRWEEWPYMISKGLW